jgi:hypothetical protein
MKCSMILFHNFYTSYKHTVLLFNISNTNSEMTRARRSTKYSIIIFCFLSKNHLEQHPNAFLSILFVNSQKSSKK